MASNSAQFGTSIFRGGGSNNNSQNSNTSGSNNNNNNNTTPQNQQLSGAQQQASHPFQSQQTTPIQQQEQQQQQQQQQQQAQASGSSIQVQQYQPGIDNTPTEYTPDARSQSPDFMATLMAKLWFDHNVESSLSSLRKEEHEKRMRDLRKQLEYINDTNWKYSPVEKFLGQH